RPWKSRPIDLLRSIISYFNRPGEIWKLKSRLRVSWKAEPLLLPRRKKPRAQPKPGLKQLKPRLAQQRPRLVSRRPCPKRLKPSRSNWNRFRNNSATNPQDNPARIRRRLNGVRLNVSKSQPPGFSLTPRQHSVFRLLRYPFVIGIRRSFPKAR